MSKIYRIELEGELIGTTRLEKADAPMGVVFGEIIFNHSRFSYDFFKSYCQSKNIEVTDDYPEDKLISTRTINSLTIKNKEGIEITGMGNKISGLNSEGFEISIEGVSYPFYEEEFPHHVREYQNKFK